MTGLEPATSGVTGRCSNQLSYIPRQHGTGCPSSIPNWSASIPGQRIRNVVPSSLKSFYPNDPWSGHSGALTPAERRSAFIHPQLSWIDVS